MMKPYFKGKTASTKPMYSRNLIHPRVYENTPQLHSACGGGNPPQCLGCGIIVQISCTMAFYKVYPECDIIVSEGKARGIPLSGCNNHTP